MEADALIPFRGTLLAQGGQLTLTLRRHANSDAVTVAFRGKLAGSMTGTMNGDGQVSATGA